MELIKTRKIITFILIKPLDRVIRIETVFNRLKADKVNEYTIKSTRFGFYLKKLYRAGGFDVESPDYSKVNIIKFYK